MDDSLLDEDRAAIMARRQRFIALALGSLATGCGPPLAGSGDTSSSSSSSTESSAEDSESSTTQPSETETGLDTETSANESFVPPSPNPCLSLCDPFAQDCPEGEKCVPAGTSNTWDTTKCVPVLGNQGVGEPCTHDGLVEATDDCDATSHCWHLELVGDLVLGECSAFCAGSPDDPECAEEHVCIISNLGSVATCLAACDPNLQDCPDHMACAWTDQTFGCMVTSGIPHGDPCNYLNDCAAGNVCVNAEFWPACEGSMCCVEFCSTDDPEACPDPQLECASFFGEWPAPQGFEDVGICVPPQP